MANMTTSIYMYILYIHVTGKHTSNILAKIRTEKQGHYTMDRDDMTVLA